MHDTTWLDGRDEDDGEPPRRIRPLLLVLASLPWLLVVGLLVLPGRVGSNDLDPPPLDGAPPADGVDDHLPEATPSVPAPPPPTEPDPLGQVPPAGTGESPAATLELMELRGRWRTHPGIEEAAAMAVVIGRAWLTGIDPILTVGGSGPQEPDGYAEHLVVEAVEQPAPGAAVVTLVGVVLDTGSSQLAPAVRRLAVPIALTDGGPRPAGEPWDLPPPALDPVVLPRQPIADPAELDAAVRALHAAGLNDHELVALHATDGWPVIAEATTPSGATEDVWLRRHVGGFVVSGTTLRGASDEPPAPSEPLSLLGSNETGGAS